MLPLGPAMAAVGASWCGIQFVCFPFLPSMATYQAQSLQAQW